MARLTFEDVRREYEDELTEIYELIGPRSVSIWAIIALTVIGELGAYMIAMQGGIEHKGAQHEIKQRIEYLRHAAATLMAIIEENKDDGIQQVSKDGRANGGVSQPDSRRPQESD